MSKRNHVGLCVGVPVNGRCCHGRCSLVGFLHVIVAVYEIRWQCPQALTIPWALQFLATGHADGALLAVKRDLAPVVDQRGNS